MRVIKLIARIFLAHWDIIHHRMEQIYTNMRSHQVK